MKQAILYCGREAHMYLSADDNYRGCAVVTISIIDLIRTGLAAGTTCADVYIPTCGVIRWISTVEVILVWIITIQLLE